MKKMLVALGLLAAVASTAWALPKNIVLLPDGSYENAKTGQKTDASGNVLNSEADKDRDSYLTPLSIYTGTIAAGAADSSSVVDLSGYRTVALLVQWSGNSTNAWQRFAVNARYNLGGASDSLSLFTLPVSVWDDSLLAVGAASRVTAPAAGALGAGEFPITIVSVGAGNTAGVASLPQGKVVFLTLPQGMTWPARCSFRFRNIGRTVAVTPTLRVWVMGTPL